MIYSKEDLYYYHVIKKQHKNGYLSLSKMDKLFIKLYRKANKRRHGDIFYTLSRMFEKNKKVIFMTHIFRAKIKMLNDGIEETEKND